MFCKNSHQMNAIMNVLNKIVIKTNTTLTIIFQACALDIINTLNTYGNPMNEVPLSPFYRWENWGTDRINNLSKVLLPEPCNVALVPIHVLHHEAA